MSVSMIAGITHGTPEPTFTISGPAQAGIASALVPDGFAPQASAPMFTITGPAAEARLRGLQQRRDDLQSQLAQLAAG